MAAIYADGFVDLKPQLSRGFGQSLSSSMGPVGKVAGTAFAAAFGVAAAAGVAGVSLGVKGLVDFAGFERSMNEVFTLLPDVSGEAMQAMSEQVRDFSTEFAVLPEDVVPALYQSLSAGIPRGNVFDFLETAQKASIAGVADLETSVGAISGTVNAYGEDVLDAGEASDIMFTTVKNGVTTFSELSSSLSNVTPIAAANKVAFGDVSAALATMTKQGTPTAQATTGIRQALVELSDTGSDVGQRFERQVGKSFREFIADGNNLGDALQIVEGTADEAGVGVDQLFGSVEAGGAVLQLTGDKSGEFQSQIDAMGDSAGATDTAYAQMDQGLSRTWDSIKATFKVGLLDIGEALAPVAQDFSDWFADALPSLVDSAVGAFQRVAGWWESNGTRIRGSVTAAFDGVTGVFQTVRNWWTNNGPSIRTAIQSAFDGVSAVVTPIIDGVVATFRRVKTWWTDNGPSIRTAIQSAFDGVSAVVTPIIDGVVEKFRAVRTWWDTNGPQITTRVTGIVDDLVAQFDRIKAWWQDQSPTVRTAIGTLGTALGAVSSLSAGPLVASVGVLTGKFEFLGPIIQRVGGWLRTAFGAAVDWVRQLLTDLAPRFDSIRQSFATITDVLGPVVAWIGERLPGAFRAFWSIAKPILGLLASILITTVRTAIDSVVQVFQGALQVIAGILQFFKGLLTGNWREAWQGIVNIVKGVANAVVGVIRAWLSIGVFKVVGKGVSLIRGLFTKGWSGIKAIFTGAASSIGGTVRGFAGRMVATIRGMVDTIRLRIMFLIDKAKSLFRDGFRVIVDTVRTAGQTLRDLVSRAFQALVTLIRNAMIGARDAVSRYISGILGFFRNLPGRIGSALSGLGSRLYDIGRNIIQAMARGVRNAASGVVDAARDVVDNAIDGAKNLLGISSPSKVFMELGGWTGEGFAIGLRDEKATVGSAANDLAQAAEITARPMIDSVANGTFGGGVAAAARRDDRPNITINGEVDRRTLFRAMDRWATA